MVLRPCFCMSICKHDEVSLHTFCAATVDSRMPVNSYLKSNRDLVWSSGGVPADATDALQRWPLVNYLKAH